MATVTTRYTVMGSGIFPFDMLRYDQSYPETPEAAAGMTPGIDGPWHASAAGPRSVELASTRELPTKRAAWFPTFGRWASFGWRVNTVNGIDTDGRGW